MALTPIDVQQKKFGTALRGYDLDEVDDFLDEVVTSLKGYEQRLVEAQERLSAVEAELAGKDQSESAISRALVAAQRSADMIVDEAKAEAERMLTEARAEAAVLHAAREEERAKLELEVSSMRAGVTEIREKVRSLAASLDTDLDEMDRSVSVAESAVATGAPTSDGAEGLGEVSGASSGEATGSDAATSSDEVKSSVEESDEPRLALDTSPDHPAAEEPPPAVVQWASSWNDEADSETVPAAIADSNDQASDHPTDASDSTQVSTGGSPGSVVSRDPLDEALAGATFSDQVDRSHANDRPVETGEGDEGEEADASEEINEGDAWDRAGLEGAEETAPEEDDRPRRPWET